MPSILICDLEGKIIDLDETMLRMFVVAKEQVMQRSILEFLIDTEVVLDRLKDIWKSAIHGKEVETEGQMNKTGREEILYLQVNLRKVI